jgi:hypothetical protein
MTRVAEGLVPAIAENGVAGTQLRAAMAGTYSMVDVPTFYESWY